MYGDYSFIINNTWNYFATPTTSELGYCVHIYLAFFYLLILFIVMVRTI